MKYNKLILSVISVFLMVLFPSRVFHYQQNKHDFISSNLLKNGTPAPYFEGESIDGRTISFSDYRGKIVLLDWWYVGCKPCIKSMRDIQLIQDKLGKDAFVILGMNPISKARAIKRFIRKYNYNHTVLMPESKIKDAYKIRAYPSIYIIGKNGRIIYAKAGYSPDFAPEMEQIIVKEIRNYPNIKM